MLSVTDQLNNEITLPDCPGRIISLVPSQTELLADLGLEEKIAGVTRYCIYPPEIFLSKPHIGGTKNFSIEKIKELKPDLIIANKEENTREKIEELQKEFNVWVSDISTVHDALEMIYTIGKITGKEKESQHLINKILYGFNQLNDVAGMLQIKNLSVAYMIWKKPYMTVGGDTFIHDMLNRCGFKNVFGHVKRYPVISAEHLASKKPEYIFLSSEPYPFREKHIDEFIDICPKAKVIPVDGEYFSWYGSRLLNAPQYFIKLLEKIFSD